MYCKHCGAEIKDGSKFCGKCGKNVEDDARASKIIIEKEKYSKKLTKDETEKQPKQKKKIKFLEMKIGLAVILIGLVLFLLKHGTYSYLAVVEDENGKYGYINERGVEVIECKYDAASIFQKNGMAVVGNIVGEDDEGRTQWKYGAINKKGNEVIPLQYDNAAFNFGELIPLAVEAGKDDLGDSIYNWGFFNKEGKQVVDFKYQYKYTPGYSETLGDLTVVSVKTQEKDWLGDYIYNYGVINSEGEEVIPISDQRIGEYNTEKLGNNGLFAVERDGKYGFINTENQVVIPFEYEDVTNFADNEMAAVKKGELWGYINTDGEVMIPFKYEEAERFGENGGAFVKENGKGKCITISDSEIFSGDWSESCSPFDERDLAEVRYENDDGSLSSVILNNNGREVIPAKYNASYYRGRAYYQNDSGESENILFGRDGEVIADGYTYASCFGDNNMAAVGSWIDQSEDGERKLYEIKFIDDKGRNQLELEKEYSYVGYFAKVE